MLEAGYAGLANGGMSIADASGGNYNVSLTRDFAQTMKAKFLIGLTSNNWSDQ